MGLEEGSGEIGGNNTSPDAGDFFDYGPERIVFAIGPEGIGN